MLRRLLVGSGILAAAVVILAIYCRDSRLHGLPDPSTSPPAASWRPSTDKTSSGRRAAPGSADRLPCRSTTPRRTTGASSWVSRSGLPTTRPTKDLLFVNPGGPGGSAVEFVDAFAANAGSEVVSRYGIVGVDPRGVGLSDPLQCLEPGARDVFLAVDPTPESKSEVRALRAAYRTLGEGCKKTNSTVAAHLSSVEVARDLDIVRALLGQRKLHFYGASYGTQIGANYAASVSGAHGEDGAGRSSRPQSRPHDPSQGSSHRIRPGAATGSGGLHQEHEAQLPARKERQGRHRLGPGRPGGLRSGAAQGARRRSHGRPRAR